MKIGIVVDNELNNDIRVLREIGILKEQGDEIFVLCFGFRKKYKIPVNEITITRFNIHRRLRDILFFMLNTIPVYEWIWALQIKKFILHNGPDILHVHDLYMARAAHSGIKKSYNEIPMILDLHENYPFAVTTYNWTKGSFRKLICRPEEWKKKEKEYIGYASRIIVLSNDFRDILLKRYPELSEENFTVLPNVPDLSKPQQIGNGSVLNPFSQSSPIIFYYGVIAERRGVFDVLKVFIDLVKEDYSVNFLIIGPVDKKDRKSFFEVINVESLANRVHYIPWIDSTKLPAYLEIIDICIAPFHKNPQHESGVANKIYDYMLGKKPIVASDCRPQKNLIEKYQCGIIYKTDAEMKEAIINLISNKEPGKEMGQNGYNAIMKELNTNVVKGQLLSMYREIVTSVGQEGRIKRIQMPL
jgi:glycosyltransferase involved in cell wall biosynthesis